MRKLIRRIRETAIGKKDHIVSSPSAKSECSALLYGSSEEEDERALLECEKEDLKVQNARQSIAFDKLKMSEAMSIQKKKRRREQLQKEKAAKEFLESEQGIGRQPDRNMFRSEYEFFLHYLWSQKGFQPEDMSDEYHNLNNPLSSGNEDKPRMQQGALKAQNPAKKEHNTTYFRAQKQMYLERVPLSFNFHVPKTLVVDKGLIKRWYQSTAEGQIKLKQLDRDEWVNQVTASKQEQKGPRLLTFKLEPDDEENEDEEKLDKDQLASKHKITKDTMSTQRCNTFLKNVSAHGFPKDTHIVQEMLHAANLKPAIASLHPGWQPVNNLAPSHEIFEVHWRRDGDALSIYRLRNLLKQSRFHIASSRSQLNTQIKPIRLKHGTVNPARALLLKLNVPQQLLYLSYEQDQNFCERQLLVADQNRLQHTLSLQALTDDNSNEMMPQADGPGRMKSMNFMQRKRSTVGLEFGKQTSNYNSPKAHKQSLEKHEIQITASEIESEAQTAIRLIRAQFMLHQLRIESGVFYFQWVHQEPESTHEPNRSISKRLYLVYVNDLNVVDRNGVNVPLPRRTIDYYKDGLTQHFTSLVRAHADLKLKERSHTDVCSCNIQIDLSPKVQPFLQNVYQRLYASDQIRHFRVSRLEPNMLTALEYLLGITEHMDGLRTQKQQRRLALKAEKGNQQLELRLEQGKECPLCDQSIESRQHWLPLSHLIYMPQQEAFIQGLGDSIPFETREKLLLSNRDLPPFLRILLPELTSVAQFQSLQNDDNWLNQKVYLSKACQQDLSQRIVGLAKQSIRLDEVQSDFQRKMLNILRKGGPAGTSSTASRLKSQRVKTNTQQMNQTARSSFTSSFPATKDDSQTQQTSRSHSRMSTRGEVKKRRMSRQSSIGNRKHSFWSSASSPQKVVLLGKKEIYEYAESLNIVIMLNGQKRASPKEVIQLIQAKQASEGHPIINIVLKRKQIAVDAISESDEDEVEQLMKRMRESSMGNQDVQIEIRDAREELRMPSKRSPSNKVQFQEQASRTAVDGFAKDEPVLERASSLRQDLHTRNTALSQGSGVIKSSLRDELKLAKQQRMTVGRALSRQDRERLVQDIVRPSINTNKEQQQKAILEHMRRSGDETFIEQDRIAHKLRRTIKDPMPVPLFEQSSIPSINSHRHLRNTLSKFSDKQNKNLKRVKSEKAIIAHQESQDDIVRKLLIKHVPDYEDKSHGSLGKKASHYKKESTELQPKDKEKVERLRRKALIEKLKVQKNDQTDKTFEMINQFNQTDSSQHKRATMREKNWKRQGLGGLGAIVGATGAGEEPDAKLVHAAMPSLVSARSLHSFEISRLTNDPIFGAINKAKIIKADQVIRDSRLKEDPSYKAALKQFKSRIKHPVTSGDFGLKKQHETIKECEQLVNKMDRVLTRDSLTKPAAIGNWNEFMLTGRLGAGISSSQANLPLKKDSKKAIAKAKQAQKMINEAEKAMSFIEYLKQRERDIAIEEKKTLMSRRSSGMVTFENPVFEEELVEPKNVQVWHQPEKTHSPWVFNPSQTDGKSPPKKPYKEQARAGDTLASERAIELIKMQNEMNEQDDKNQINLRESLLSLSTIDRNTRSSTKIMGRSKTVGLLPKVRKTQRNVFKNTLGKSVTVGTGRISVVAKDQKQANFINTAKKHLDSQLDDIKLTELFR